MRVGIIAEGWFDFYVVRNVLKGRLGIFDDDVESLRPQRDETDANDPSLPKAADTFGNFEIVRDECRSRDKIRRFLDGPIEGEKLVVVHLDTDRIEQLGIERPAKDKTAVEAYVDALRARVVEAIESWLEDERLDAMRFAVAIEESEVWLLQHWDARLDVDAASKANVKEALTNAASRRASDKERRFLRADVPTRAAFLSDHLRKGKTLAEAVATSRSLALFVDSLPRPDDDDGAA